MKQHQKFAAHMESDCWNENSIELKKKDRILVTQLKNNELA